MPTLRERTSTLSAAIVGTSISRTAARCGSSKTSAFIRSHFSLVVDQDLDFICRTRGEPSERVRCLVELDYARHRSLNRKIASGNLGRNPVEVVDPVTPCSDDG